MCASKMQSASIDTHAVKQFLTCYLKKIHTKKTKTKQHSLVQRTLVTTNSEESTGLCLSKKWVKSKKVKFFQYCLSLFPGLTNRYSMFKYRYT